jgi:hypothetical protein
MDDKTEVLATRLVRSGDGSPHDALLQRVGEALTMGTRAGLTPMEMASILACAAVDVIRTGLPATPNTVAVFGLSQCMVEHVRDHASIFQEGSIQ